MRPDAKRSIESYARLAAGYDRSCRLVMPLRHEAVAALGLRGGETVLDVACGTGLSLPLLAEAVGGSGRVIGVEHSRDMMDIARRRVADGGWRNVELVGDSLERARLPSGIQAILFHFTHDVLQSDAALENIFAASCAGARVVSAGTKLTSWGLVPVNLWVLWRARRYLTTYANLREPWRHLSPHVPELRVESRLLDTAYLAVGTLARGAPCPTDGGNP